MSDLFSHPDRDVDVAVLRLCQALVCWERATGRQSVLILRENNGELAGERIKAPGYVFRAVNGCPLGSSNDDLPDDHILRPFVCEVPDAARRFDRYL
jgi:hypothetical protein